MNKGHLSTESYKGVRDFYPPDMAILQFIFDNWVKTAESFGFERYDASILEPSELYKSKGVENAEIVNEQTYTFIDRGEREVTLRPEMTPTVARMVAGKRRELHFPLRWYSIPNLFRYERPQRGRLREHWQLNCDIFGADDYTADVEIITLAQQILLDFGATAEMFEIRVNNRANMQQLYESIGIKETVIQHQITKLNDRFRKITQEVYLTELTKILQDKDTAEKVFTTVTAENQPNDNEVVAGLAALGITNVKLDYTLARGFDYYTGTIFEIFDTSGINNRSLLGGGRYDNLTTMFNSEPISGVGFGMGDVTIRDFLETHKLLPESVSKTASTIVVIPTDEQINLAAQKIAQHIRARGIKVATDISNKKIGKKIADAALAGVTYTLVVGTNELSSGVYSLRNLVLTSEESGSLEDILTSLISNT